MSFFDRFRSSAAVANRRPVPSRPSEIRRWAVALTKQAREHERQRAIEALARIGDAGAAAALLRRFTFDTEPSITDREEKDSAFKAIVAIGEEALPAVRAACARGEGITWCVRLLRALLDDEAYVDEVSELLEEWDTEYVRDPEPKIRLLAACELVEDERVPGAVERFLGDVHEPTRFQAVGAILAQREPTAAGPLARALVREEAARTVTRIAEGLAVRAWPVPEPERHALARALPRRYRLDEHGVVRVAFR